MATRAEVVEYQRANFFGWLRTSVPYFRTLLERMRAGGTAPHLIPMDALADPDEWDPLPACLFCPADVQWVKERPAPLRVAFDDGEIQRPGPGPWYHGVCERHRWADPDMFLEDPADPHRYLHPDGGAYFAAVTSVVEEQEARLLARWVADGATRTAELREKLPLMQTAFYRVLDLAIARGWVIRRKRGVFASGRPLSPVPAR